MLKIVYTLILLGAVLNLSAVEIEMKEGKEAGKKFSTLNLKSEKAIRCIRIFDEFDIIEEIECHFKSRYNKKLKSFSNSFFDVIVKVKNKVTVIKIQPRYNSTLFSSDTDISTLKYFIPREEKESAKHWLVIGFKGKNAPFLKGANSYNPRTINFPISLDFKKNPFIGALDIDGNPIKEGESEDVKAYLDLKRDFTNGQYRAVVNKSSDIIKKFPHTLFRPELSLYHIRALFKLKAYQQIINISKDFLRNFSNDNAVPEVLLYTAYVHSKLGFLAYAKYYFTRLFEEHKDSEYRNMGFVYYGDDRIYGGKKSEGIQLYKKALYNTRDKLIATKAAYRLGNMYLKDLKPDQSEYYLSKVVNGNPSYFKRNIPANYKLAKDLADEKKFNVASEIMSALLKGEDSADLDNYEVMLKDLALWLDKSGKVEKAYKEYAKYLDTYDYGVFDELVRVNQDRLLFLRNESNNSKRFANYNKLIKTYGLESDIGKQAIYEKAKLLHDTDEFGMVLELEKDLEIAKEDFPDSEKVIKDSAVQETIRYLNGQVDNSIEPLNLDEATSSNKDVMKRFSQEDSLERNRRENCQNAIKMIDKYQINIPHKEDENLYLCSMKTGKYSLAKKIVKRNIDDSQNTLDWVYRYSQILLKTGKYKKFISLSDEVISLMNLDGNDKYLDIYYDRFKAFNILRKDDEVIKTVNMLDKYFKNTYRNLQPFKSVVSIAKDRKDDLLIERFAKRVLKIQKRLKSYVQTPEIELLLITSLKHQNKIDEAIEISEELLKRDIEPNSKARVFYELGISYQILKNSNKAKYNFEQSYKVAPDNVWGELSKDYLDMF